MVQNNNKAMHNVSPEKLSVDVTYFALATQGCDYYTELDIVLLFNYFGVFGEGTCLAMSKTI